LAFLLWDASALAKRYVPETGSEAVHALFGLGGTARMAVTMLGYAETLSVLTRKRNRGEVSPATFTEAKTLLRTEVANNPMFSLLTLDDAAVLAGLAFIDQHNLNATDAAILALYLRYSRMPRPGSERHWLVASDKRLLSAARAEGMAALDPEVVRASEVSHLLAVP
jgi:predicted nucleic acid-binding protein